MGADNTKQIHLTKKRNNYRVNGKPKKSSRWFFKKKYKKLGFREEIASSFQALYIEESGAYPAKYHRLEKEPAEIGNDGNHFAEVYGPPNVSAGSSEADVLKRKTKKTKKPFLWLFKKKYRTIGQEKETAENRNVVGNFAEKCRSTDVSPGSSEIDVDSTCSGELARIEQAYPNREDMSSSPDSAVDADLSTDSCCSSVEDCSLCNAANIEYMVETFMDFLQNNLNINEILPYLHYIADDDEMMLKAIIPQSRAVRHLIYIIRHRTDEKGKWTTFLLALDRTGHKYAYQLLKGETEKDHVFRSRLLKIMKPELINRICLCEFIDPLFERDVINDNDKEEIESAEKNKGPLEATRILLNKVDKKSPNWDTEFADVLLKAGMAEIADIFKMVEHHTHNEESDTNRYNSKQTTRQSSERKFKKGKRRCRLHGQSKSLVTTGSLGEPGIKRLRKQRDPFCIGLNEEAATNVKEDEMKNVNSELQVANVSSEPIIVMQKDMLGKMDTLINILTAKSTKFDDEQALMKRQIEEQKRQIEEQNHRIKCMDETLTKLLSYQQDRKLEKDPQKQDTALQGQSSGARIRRWRVK